MIKLLIDDVEVDVLQTESIVGEYSIAPIGNVSKRTGARSITFKLPKTAKNRAVFESCEVLTSQSVKPYRRLKARLYVDGVDMNMLFFTLERVKDYYEGRVYGSNVDFFATIKDKQLRDLDLAAYNHHWDYTTVQNSRFNSSGYIYGIINWNTEDSILSNDVKEGVNRLLVSVYAETLLNEICKQSGYSFVNGLLNDTDYAAQDLIVCAGNVKYNRNKDANKYRGAVYTMDDMPASLGLYLPFEHNTLVSENETFFSNQNPPYKTPNSLIGGGLLSFANKIKLDWTLDLKLYNLTGTIQVLVIRALTRKAITTGAANIVQTFSIGIPPTGAVTPFETQISGSYILSGYDIADVDVEFAAPSISFSYRMPANCYALQDDCIFTILDTTEIIEDDRPDVNGREIKDDEIAPIKYYAGNIGGIFPKQFDYVTPDSLMPDVKQSDFVKDFLLLHGAVLQVNEKLKIVTLSKFEDVLNSIGRAIDWSGRVDFIEENTVEFQLDYAQNNLLKYADEEGVVKPDGTDGNLTVDDENLELEKDFITLNFGATVATNWFNNPNNPVVYDTPQIKVLEGGVVTNQTEPRWLYLTKLDGYFHTYRDGVFITDHNTSIPITWFIDPVRANSLGFGTNIYQRYYSFLEGILDRTKVIECRVRLGASDIALLDFLRPVYIKELDGYFFVSKVKFDYTYNKSSIVELVKLL